MNRADSRLVAALGLSLALHLLPALPGLILPSQKASTAKMPPLLAELRPPAPPAPELLLKTPETPPPLPEKKLPPPEKKAPPEKKPPPLPVKAAANPPKTWTQAVKQHLQKLDAAGRFYPAAAIASGQQGTVEVLMMLNESGKVVAARVEQGSGYPLLDNAALQAVRSLSTLPADAPRQVVLPVRFRLH